MSKQQRCARCRQFFHRLYLIIDLETGLQVRVCDACERWAAAQRQYAPGGPWWTARNAGKGATT